MSRFDLTDDAACAAKACARIGPRRHAPEQSSGGASLVNGDRGMNGIGSGLASLVLVSGAILAGSALSAREHANSHLTAASSAGVIVAPTAVASPVRSFDSMRLASHRGRRETPAEASARTF